MKEEQERGAQQISPLTKQPFPLIGCTGRRPRWEISGVMSSSFEKAIEVWSEIGLSGLQKTLDDEGSAIIEQQAESVKGRKELAATTKQFRKLDDEEKLGQIKGLLKLYQTEIDSLTNRSKFAETCFMKVYKSLAEAPDPTPLLEASVESVASASELARLAAENSRLNDIVSRHADYDTVKGKLLKLEMDHAQTLESRVSAKQAEMEAIFDEKERNWQAREKELVKELGDLRANQEVAQAQQRTNAVDADTNGAGIGDDKSRGRLAELEIVAHDLERANRAAAQAEKRNVELRAELEALKSGDHSRQQTQQLETRVADLEGENSILNAKVSSITSKYQRESAGSTQKIESLERELNRKTHEAETLKARLDGQTDYAELKRELEVIKSIEFGQDDGKDDGSDRDRDEERSKLESQLLAKNKKMNSEMTSMRVSNNKLKNEIDRLSSELSRVGRELEETLVLNAKLETDLSEMRKASNSPPGSTVSGWTAWPRGDGNNNSSTSPTASIVDGITGGSSSAASLASLRGGPSPQSVRGGGLVAGGAGGAGAVTNENLLQIVTQQRDRFRARNVELESELRKNTTMINTLRKETEAIKKDNLELYERTRYMQSYDGGSNNKNNSTSAASKYQSLYEEGLSPFQQFRGKESERILSQLGPFERIVHKFLRTVLNTRTTMNVFVVYCLFIHVVFTVMVFRCGPRSNNKVVVAAGSTNN